MENFALRFHFHTSFPLLKVLPCQRQLHSQSSPFIFTCSWWMALGTLAPHCPPALHCLLCHPHPCFLGLSTAVDPLCISSCLLLFLSLNVESLQCLTLNHAFLCISFAELIYLLKNASCQLDSLIPLPHPIRKMLVPTLPFSETCLVQTSLGMTPTLFQSSFMPSVFCASLPCTAFSCWADLHPPTFLFHHSCLGPAPPDLVSGLFPLSSPASYHFPSQPLSQVPGCKIDL